MTVQFQCVQSTSEILRRAQDLLFVCELRPCLGKLDRVPLEWEVSKLELCYLSCCAIPSFCSSHNCPWSWTYVDRFVMLEVALTDSLCILRGTWGQCSQLFWLFLNWNPPVFQFYRLLQWLHIWGSINTSTSIFSICATLVQWGKVDTQLLMPEIYRVKGVANRSDEWILLRRILGAKACYVTDTLKPFSRILRSSTFHLYRLTCHTPRKLAKPAGNSRSQLQELLFGPLWDPCRKFQSAEWIELC